MIIIEPSFSIIEETNIAKKIEMAARTCYKSEDMITNGSALKMVSALVNKCHLAMLEHASIAVEVSEAVYVLIAGLIRSNYSEDTVIPLNNLNYKGHPSYVNRVRYTSVHLGNRNRYIVSANCRAWKEFFDVTQARLASARVYTELPDSINQLGALINNEAGFKLVNVDAELNAYNDYGLYIINDKTLRKLTPLERDVHMNMTVRFTVDRGVTHELVRMRDCSFAQESTRYCNYSNGKFGKEITVIRPITLEGAAYDAWEDGCRYAEKMYFEMISNNASAQLARDVFPTSVKADIVVTAPIYEWKHMFALRALDATGPAHPQMKEVMLPLYQKVTTDETSIYFGIFDEEL